MAKFCALVVSGYELNYFLQAQAFELGRMPIPALLLEIIRGFVCCARDCSLNNHRRLRRLVPEDLFCRCIYLLAETPSQMCKEYRVLERIKISYLT